MHFDNAKYMCFYRITLSHALNKRTQGDSNKKLQLITKVKITNRSIYVYTTVNFALYLRYFAI